jgi:RecA-family ATPase
MAEKQYHDKMDSYTWKEVLAGTAFINSGEEKMGSSIATRWELPGYNEDVYFLTFESDNSMFLFSKSNERILYGTISKYELARTLKFDGNNRLASEFASNGLPMIRSILSELREDYQANLDFEYGHLPVAERKFYDPALQTAIQMDLRRREASNEAERLFEIAKHRDDLKTPKGLSLSEFIDKPLESQRWLIEGILPVNGNASVVAAMKTGKSTFVYNIMHSLLLGEPLLNYFRTNEFEGRIGFVNFELTEEQCQDWFVRSPIGKTDRIYVWNLRGEPNPFRTDQSIADFSKEVSDAGIRVLILDPWSSLFVGDTNSNDEVKQFWLTLDAFKKSSGVKELIIPIHAGRDATKSRGASTLDDHPDSIIHLTRHSDGIRTLHARGRDVEVPEGELTFDKDTLLLSYKGAVTPEAKDERIAKQLVKIIEQRGKVSATEIYRCIDKGKTDVQAAREMLVKRGELLEEKIGSSKFYELNPKHISSLPNASREMPEIGMDPVSSAISREQESLSENEVNESKCKPCHPRDAVQSRFSGIEVRMCQKCDFIHEVWAIESIEHSDGEGDSL